MVRLAALAGAGCMLIGALVSTAPALAAAPVAVDGWTFRHGARPEVCIANGPSEAAASVGLVALGPQFLLVLQAPDFPQDKGSYVVSLSFDGAPPIQATALGQNGILSIGVGRGDAAKAVASAKSVAVMANGQSHSFSLHNASAAMDGVARCAGEPTLAEQVERPPVAISGAGAWKLATTLPGLNQPVCEARVAGDQIDTIIVLNKAGNLLLMGGHSDWASWGGDVPLKLAIDGAPPVSLSASSVGALIMAEVKDPALVKRLRGAKLLVWELPNGHVRGNVTGLGVALDAVRTCNAHTGGR